MQQTKSNTVFQIYNVLRQNDKYSCYMTEEDVIKITPKLDHQETRALLEEIGFKNATAELIKRTCTFEKEDDLRVGLKCVLPFSLPTEIFNDFAQDIQDLAKKGGHSVSNETTIDL